jgi:cytochrome c5
MYQIQEKRETTVSQQDRHFLSTFGYVLGGLIVLALIFVFTARMLSETEPEEGGSTNKMAQQAVQQRIEPVGKVVTGETKTAEASAASSGGGLSGKEVVSKTCSGCHQTGVAGAPKIGDQAAWSERAKPGLATMLKIAVNGKGAMPPRGGGNYSDAEMKKAILYMLEQSDVKVSGGEAASTEKSASASSAAGGESKANTMGKEVVDKTCGTCHKTGVAGAPKIGDKAAWSQRAKKGLDGLLNTAINGKGAMPPRGGGTYDKEHLKAAIEYMLSQSGVEAK